MSQRLELKEWKRCRELGYKHFHHGQQLSEAEEQEFRELNAKFANFDGVAVVLERLERRETQLVKALEYLKVAKRRFAPNTTNSFADELIAELEAELNT